jgi:hypothetical protein
LLLLFFKGPEVALYCSKYLPEYLKTLEEYSKGDLEEALKKLFLKFDASLITESAQKELTLIRDMNCKKESEKSGGDNKEDANETESETDVEKNDDEHSDEKIKKQESKNEKNNNDIDKDDDEDDDDEANETAKLYDEATMPLEEVDI